MQTISVGNPLPQLLWDFGWLVILGIGAVTGEKAVAGANRESGKVPAGAEAHA
jgi:hypothetical protein